MNKFIIAGAAVLAASLTVAANPITPEQALARISNGQAKIKAAGAPRPTLRHIETTSDGASAAYVFATDGEAGFMILSADDMAYPLLGYTDEGTFDINNIPPAMEWLLGEYSRQIEYARENIGDEAKSRLTAQALNADARQGKTSINPLIKTHWDQNEPYNNSCPLYGVTRSYTGCVATSMAQVLNYWKYPEKGTGTISYDCESLQKKLSLNLSLKSFDWDNMRDIYITGQYNDVEAAAVAYLMKACGYAVHMQYGTDSSGALAMDVRQALCKYFGYDGNMKYTLRDYYTTTEWNEMMYDNIKNVGPVIYGGGSLLGGGHSFICDGYDSETGLFHFNWGWTGMSNGYYSLDALNPDALGTGGGSGGGYNFTQDAVFGIQPPTGEEIVARVNKLTMQGSLVADIVNDGIEFDLDMQNGAMWVNYNPETMYVEVGASFVSQTSADKTPVYFSVSNKRYSVTPGYGFSAHSIVNGVDYGLMPRIELSTLRSQLADGTYKVTFVSRDNETANSPWIDMLCPYGYYDYVIVEKNGNNITVQDIPAPSLDILSGAITTTLMPYNLVKVVAEIKNPSAFELSTGLAPALVLDGSMYYLGESVFVTVPAHGKVTKEWITSFTPMNETMMAPAAPMDFSLLFFDERSYLFYDFIGTATMHPQTNPGVSLYSTPTVTNASRTNVSRLSTTYYISDPSEINISTEFLISNDDFAYELMACICQPEDDMIAICAIGGDKVFATASAEPRKVDCTINYASMQPGELYYLYSAVYAGGYVLIPGTQNVFIILETTGVENVSTAPTDIKVDYDSSTRTIKASSAAGISTIEAYSLNGSLINSCTDCGSLSLEDATSSLIIVRATDSYGNTETVKIAR